MEGPACVAVQRKPRAQEAGSGLSPARWARRRQSAQGLEGRSLGSGLHPKGRGGALSGESALTSAPEGRLADGGAWGSEA